MNRTIFVYLPFVFFIVLIAGALLIAAGPSLGEPFLTAHDSLRAMFTTVDESPVDGVVAAAVGGDAPLPSLYTVGQRLAAPARPAPMTIPVRIPGVPPALDETCAALHFAGAVGIQDGRISFGRFTPIQTAYPFAAQDPLISWKLLQFESLPFTLDPTGLKVDKAVNLLLSDPFTQTPLLSARWQIDQIVVQGKHAGINAALRVNLSDIRIDNAINSPALAQLKSETGILTMHIEYSQDLRTQIEAGAPIFASMQGTLYASSCLR